MKTIITTLVAALVVLSASTAYAGIIERSCECQGFGAAGDNIPAGDTDKENLTTARKEAVEDCRAGTYYRGAANNCTLPACPAGSIDVTPYDSNGRSLLVDCTYNSGDILRTWDRHRDGAAIVHDHTPAGAGCQRFTPSSGAAFYQCSMTCKVKRQCAL